MELRIIPNLRQDERVEHPQHRATTLLRRGQTGRGAKAPTLKIPTFHDRVAQRLRREAQIVEKRDRQAGVDERLGMRGRGIGNRVRGRHEVLRTDFRRRQGQRGEFRHRLQLVPRHHRDGHQVILSKRKPEGVIARSFADAPVFATLLSDGERAELVHDVVQFLSSAGIETAELRAVVAEELLRPQKAGEHRVLLIEHDTPLTIDVNAGRAETGVFSINWNEIAQSRKHSFRGSVKPIEAAERAVKVLVTRRRIIERPLEIAGTVRRVVGQRLKAIGTER